MISLHSFASLDILICFMVKPQLSQWISSKGIEGGHGMTQYASMTSSLLILRIGLVTYYASEIHENAHQILVVAGKCSSSTYSISVMWIKTNLILNVTFTTCYICNLTIIAGAIMSTSAHISV